MNVLAALGTKSVTAALQHPLEFEEQKRDPDSISINAPDLLFNFPICNMASFTKSLGPLSWYTWWATRRLRLCINLHQQVIHQDISKAKPLEIMLKIWKSIAHELKKGGDVSLRSIRDGLDLQGLIKIPGEHEGRVALYLIHSIIGIQTMLYTSEEPETPLEKLALRSEVAEFEGQAIMSDHQDFSRTGEDIHQYLLQFGMLLPPPRYTLLAEQAAEELKGTLCTQIRPAVLNASNLATTGRVSFRWTDSLACHLEFNMQERELFLFRYPSYCIHAWTPDPVDEMSRGAIHGCAKQKRQHTEWATAHEVSQLMREIILSYRLLFGQDRASRHIYKKTLHPWYDVPSAGQDKMLHELCSKANFDCQLDSCEKDIYTVKTDFPMLHGKLVRLQMFLDSTRPQTIRELWKDRRDSSSWLTLWVVIIIGSLSLLLALMQVVLQIAQLALQSRSKV